jgi:hypothetical protein
MSRFAMFTFATTVTAFGAIGGCDSSNGDDMGSGIADYGAAVCEDNDCGILDDGGAGTLYGLADAQFVDDASPDASDGSFIDDSGDAGEDAD